MGWRLRNWFYGAVLVAGSLPLGTPIAFGACRDQLRDLFLDPTSDSGHRPISDRPPIGQPPGAVIIDLGAFANGASPANAVQIGTGSVGDVYNARLTINGCATAAIVKVFRRLYARPELNGYARMEYQNLVNIQAANAEMGVVRRFPSPIGLGVQEDGSGIPAFAMEPVPNSQTLYSMLSSEGDNAPEIRPQDVLVFGIELAEAMRQVHRVVIHGDIKPKNILVVREAGSPLRVILIDFSVSEAAGQLVIGGTPGFLYPGQLSAGGRLTADMDIWAAARTIEMTAFFSSIPFLNGEPGSIPAAARDDRMHNNYGFGRSIYTSLKRQAVIVVGSDPARAAAAEFYAHILMFSEFYPSATIFRDALVNAQTAAARPLSERSAAIASVSGPFAQLFNQRFSAADADGRLDYAMRIAGSSELINWIAEGRLEISAANRGPLRELLVAIRSHSGSSIVNHVRNFYIGSDAELDTAIAALQ